MGSFPETYNDINFLPQKYDRKFLTLKIPKSQVLKTEGFVSGLFSFISRHLVGNIENTQYRTKKAENIVTSAE